MEDGRIDKEKIKEIGDKFATINGYIERGEEIPSELTKNFISCPLIDNPFDEIE